MGKAASMPENYDSIAKRIYKMKSVIPVDYNQYVQTEINAFIKNDNSATANLLGKSLYNLPEIEKILKRNRLPAELKYLAISLSDLNNHKVSADGSSGIWQLKYHVAKTYNLKINSYIDERRDPLKATEAASKYLEELYKIYEDWPLTIAAFYSSSLDVNKAIRQSGGKLEYWKIHSYLNENVQQAVPRFIATMYLLTYFREHKLIPIAFKPIETDTVAIVNWTTFEQINKVMSIEVSLLKEYNPIFKKSIIPYTPSKYYIHIPSASLKFFREMDDSLYIFKNKEPGLVTTPDNKPKPTQPGDSTSTETEAGNKSTTAAENEEAAKPKPKPNVENTKGLALLTYTVKKGDGLGKIADKYDCTISEIKKWNKLKSNMIKPGQKLKIYVPKALLSKYKKKK